MIQRLGPLLALESAPRAADAPERVWIVDGTLIPVRDRGVGASSRNYRFSANVQVIVDAETRRVVATRPVPGNTADARAWRDSGLADQCHDVTMLGDGAYINTRLIVPHRKHPGRTLLNGEEEDNAAHRKVRARVEVEHVFIPDGELQDPPRLPTARRRPPPRGPGPPPECTTSPSPHDPPDPAARFRPLDHGLVQHPLVQVL